MKKLLTILFALFCGILFGQVPPPPFVPFVSVPPAAADINTYDFYIDSVSGITLQSQGFANTQNNSSVGLSINVATVPSGVHQLYAKVTNTSGNSSIFSVGNFFKEGAGFTFPAIPLAANNINKYDFFIDSVGASNGQTQSFTSASANSITAQSINLASAPVGVHQLYAKVTSTMGESSI
jgi:hypothetical protein